uniref:RRM domain-containing protein n=1 Tax=Tetraodon nigroviridis TaxID=99883 RepID=H3CSX0_TETNG
TKVVQVTNVSPSATSEQMRTLFGFLGTIEELKLFPPDDSPMPVTSRVCFVKFQEPESVGVSQHLTNTVFVDRALIVVPFAEGSIPDEAKALSLLAPANAVAGNLPGGGLLPTPLPNAPMGGNPFGVPNIDPMAAFGFPGPNMNPQQAADQLFKLMTDPKLNPLAAGLNLSASLKADASSKEIEEAMRRVRETQSLISAAIEPGGKDSKRRTRSRSRSKSRRRRSGSRSRYSEGSSSRSRRRSNSRNRRRSKSPYQKRSRDRNRRSRTRSSYHLLTRTNKSTHRDRKKEDSNRRRSRTPPKSYSSSRRSPSRNRRRRRSQSISRSPKRKHSRSPSPRRHRDRKTDKDYSREEREPSSSKKKKNKDKDETRRRERRHQVSLNAAVLQQVTRDYDEEEQGYDSEKEREERKYSDAPLSPQSAEGNGTSRPHKAKVNGADSKDMDVSD